MLVKKYVEQFDLFLVCGWDVSNNVTHGMNDDNAVERMDMEGCCAIQCNGFVSW